MRQRTVDAAPSPLRIAVIGTRGVPARYGGFETAAEEVGRRLVDMGHEVTVYGRDQEAKVWQGTAGHHAGMRTIALPALRHRALETLSHTILSSWHALTKEHFDVAIIMNAANSSVLPMFRMRRIPVALHVDGLEWRRTKWNGGGQRFYRVSESLGVRWADALIADSRGIERYYADEFGIETRRIAYGAPDLAHLDPHRVGELGLDVRGFHLVVARMEPENNVRLMMEGYLASSAQLPLVVVGSNPYPSDYTTQLEELAATSDRIRMVGSVWDQELLDHLYAGALTYLHGHSVGGTNPSMLRAMGAATYTIAHDNSFNLDMFGTHLAGDFPLVLTPAQVARAIEAAEADPARTMRLGKALHAQAVRRYDWDAVAQGYADLCRDLVAGHSTRGQATGRRAPNSGWTATADPASGGHPRAGNIPPAVVDTPAPQRAGAGQ